MDIQQLLSMLRGGLGAGTPGIGGMVQMPGQGGLGSMQIPGMNNEVSPTPAPGGQPQAMPPPQAAQPQGFMNKLRGGIGRIRERMLPVDPRVAQGMDPAHLEALRRQAMIQAGIGMIGADSSGQNLGQSLASGLGQGFGSFQQGVGSAYKVGRDERQDKREDAADARVLRRDDIMDKRYEQQREYQEARDELGDERWKKEFDSNERYRNEVIAERRERQRLKHQNMAVYDDPATLRRAALVVMSDPSKIREIASFGEGGQDIRNRIQGEMTRIQKETGMSDSDFIRLRARSVANTSNLATLEKQASQVGAAVQLAKANGDRVMQLISKIDDTGVPMIEGVKRAVAKGTGGIDEAELSAVLVGFQTEVARILSGHPEMRGVISDSLRHEIEQMAPGNMTAEQAKRVINRLYVEMDVRLSSIDDAINNAVNTKTMGLGQAPVNFQEMFPAQPTAAAPGDEQLGPNQRRIVDVPF